MSLVFGRQALATTKKYLHYGTVEATIRAAPGNGVITAMTLIDPTKAAWDPSTGTGPDEIDWEWVGADTGFAWTNFFWRGLRQRDPATTFEVWSHHAQVDTDPTKNFHVYKIDWTPYQISWSIDDKVVWSQNKNETWQLANGNNTDGYKQDHYHYPDSPMILKLGVWNSQEKAWALGPQDWSSPAAQQGYQAYMTSLKISCYTGPFPTNPNAPPTDPTSQDRNGKAPNVTVPSVTAGVTTTAPQSTPAPGEPSNKPISFPSGEVRIGGVKTVVLGAVLGLVAYLMAL
ncbi:hypothetical protein HDU97_001332 [Phlyctochytrium planicorne]|nr:hypothetical protein HDU97_001332 [Phlyctochytrium planicorne]